MSEQARVKIVCPECGGPLPPDAAHVAVKCERCGHSSAPAARATAQLPCPRCRAPLFDGDAYGVTLLGCGVCGGVFLDNEGSTRITRAHDSVLANLAERVKDRAVARAVDTRPHDLPCPSCTTPMKRVLARGVVEIDYCAQHGTWFDRAELNQVMHAYARRTDVIQRDERAEAEARMAAFRERQITAIDSAETATAVGAFGVTVGILGVLGALVGSSKS